MEDCKVVKQNNPTLMEAYHTLDNTLLRLRAAKELTLQLNHKLNRTEAHPEETQFERGEGLQHQTIVGLFNSISEMMEEEITDISKVTSLSMDMIG
jgi:hypothetical protein